MLKWISSPRNSFEYHSFFTIGIVHQFLRCAGSRTDKAGLALKGKRSPPPFQPELAPTSFLTELQMQWAVKILDLINTLGFLSRCSSRKLLKREKKRKKGKSENLESYFGSRMHPLFVSKKMFNVFSSFDYEILRVHAFAFLIHFPESGSLIMLLPINLCGKTLSELLINKSFARWHKYQSRTYQQVSLLPKEYRVINILN